MIVRNVLVSMAAMCLCAPAMAGLIEIQMTGVNLTYTDADGGGAGTGSLFDTGGSTDPLNGLDFLMNGALVGSLGAGDNLALDFSATGLPSIAVPPPGNTTSVSGVSGSLELFAGGGSILHVSLSSIEVAYTIVGGGPGTFHFQFTGAIGSVTSQSLPFGLLIGDPITISFSQQGTPTSSGGFLTSFIGSGTGEISGVPAPGALALLGVAGLCGRRRRRN